jgi:V/A-type H+-transporting ATPase subunit D
MMNQMAPTKANLIKSKSMLEFSIKGYDLLDKKRSVLIREVMGLISSANKIQEEIDKTFEEAYYALKIANITMGVRSVEEIAYSIPKSEDYTILITSVMGVEIADIRFEEKRNIATYGFYRTNAVLDKAVEKFMHLRYKIYELSEIESSVYKLAMEIKKTQKRANALDKIQIPKYRELAKNIQETLEEKERAEFFRLKIIKNKK